jgi:transposase
VESILSKQFVGADGVSRRKNDFHMLRTPKVVRQQAMKSALSVLKAQRTRINQQVAKRIKYPKAIAFKRALRFRPGFKCRKGWHRDSISFELTNLRVDSKTTFTLFPNHRTTVKSEHQAHHQVKKGPTRQNEYPTRGIKIKSTRALATLSKDFKVHLCNGKWFLILPHTVNVTPQVVSDDIDDVCAIDPGIRKPFSTYSPQGKVEVIGVNTKKVAKRCFKRSARRKRKMVVMSTRLEELRAAGASRQAKAKCRVALLKWRARFRAAELKQKNVVKNFHYRVAHHLLRSYKTVILPNTSTHHCRRGRRLHASTKKMMLFLAHGQFGRRLVETASFYPDHRVMRGSEAYTSKQCGQCGKLNDNLGSSEVFKCGCGARADRDVHAARNILLRFLNN